MKSIDLFNELRAGMGAMATTSQHGNDLLTHLENSSGAVSIFQEFDGRIGLFIPLGSGDPRIIRADLRSKYITLRTVLRGDQEMVQLQLENPLLENVFHVFTDTYFKKFRENPELAATVVQAQLQKWRTLFTPTAPNSLSDSEEIGLLCELQEMQELLSTDGSLAFHRWTGPDQQAHDFRFANRSVECKSTRVPSGLHITINGATQLVPEPDRALLLAVRKYESSPNGELALSEVVRDLIEDDRIPADELLSRLEEMGFSIAGVDAGTENRYRLTGRYVFEVGEGFPRLVLNGTEDRVSDVHYRIDLSSPETVPGYREDGELV